MAGSSQESLLGQQAPELHAALGGNGPDVQVKVLKGENVVVTVPAKLAQAKGGQRADAIMTRTVDNLETLDEVDFGGGKQSLVFEEATATESSSGRQ